MNAQPATISPRHPWRAALWHALPVSALVLALLYRWFAVADRYLVFLYYHDMGPKVPDTAPFSIVTRSRYWMTGLVAGGAVLLLYILANGLLGRLKRGYHPPAWWRVWVVSAAPLLVGVPLITMTVNAPTLPAANAAQVTLAALLAVGLALTPGRLAAERPGALILLTLEGGGLAAVMLSVALLERLGMLSEGNVLWPLLVLALGLGGGVVLLLLVTGLRAWQHWHAPGAVALFAAGLSVAYLCLPLLHHLLFTRGYGYISDSDNYFSRSLPLQLLAWLVGAALAWGVTRLEREAEARATS